MTDAPRDDAQLRASGRALLVAIHGAGRALKLYPVENVAVQRALDDLLATGESLLRLEGAIDVRLSGDVIFVNQTRLRLGLDNFAAFSGFVGLMHSCGIGVLRVEDGVTRREWQAWLSILGSLPSADEPLERMDQLRQRMQQADITCLMVETGGGDGEEGPQADEALERAKRTYAHGVAVARDVVSGVRMGRTPSVRRLKRAIQLIVDQVLENELSIAGLTTLRDYDEYTFTHCVNVCIFSVALGKRLGLDRRQLYDLGLAALLHDIGKSRLDIQIVNKDSALDDQEWRQMQAHPWLGTLTLFKMREGEELPYRAILAAHEHHMKVDLSGYPRPNRPLAGALLTARRRRRRLRRRDDPTLVPDRAVGAGGRAPRDVAQRQSRLRPDARQGADQHAGDLSRRQLRDPRHLRGRDRRRHRSRPRAAEPSAGPHCHRFGRRAGARAGAAGRSLRCGSRWDLFSQHHESDFPGPLWARRR
jgi:hypothetical protein